MNRILSAIGNKIGETLAYCIIVPILIFTLVLKPTAFEQPDPHKDDED